MSSPDENIDPHSLPKLSLLLSNSAHKRNNKHNVHKGPSPVPALRQSTLPNSSTHRRHALVERADMQLPTPPSSQSMDPAHDNVADEPRLPISPPPEEELRIKEHSHTPKQKNQSRLPLPSRAASSATFKFPAPPQSFAQYQQQVHQRPDGGPMSTTSAADAPPTSTTNPRKRARSVIPHFVVPATASSAPSAPSSSQNDSQPVASSTVAQSPNPKPRKQSKVHGSGVYDGSGFKRRHTRGTSAESLNLDEPGDPMPNPRPLKSPARKKRTTDLGVEDYTPQRERISKNDGSSKRKARPRRSATPDVPYEPPTEQFTPPRHVVLQVPSSTTSTRSRKPRQSSAQPNSSIERKVVRVKLERLTSPFPLPPIDLSKPTAPPSPTDDPILLVGPLLPTRGIGTANKTLVDAAVGEDDAGGLGLIHDEPSTPVHASSRHAADESTWHMRPAAGEETALMDVGFDEPSHFDATFDPASDSDEDDAAPLGSTAFSGRSPGLDPDKSTGSHIFHSDDDEAEKEVGEDEGEYTGRFKFYSVPVKQDPPSSATRVRRESWGRPISPFPFQRRGSEQQVDVNDERTQELSDGESPPPSPSDGRRRPGTPRHATGSISLPSTSGAQPRRSGGFTLSEMEARIEARKAARREAGSHEEAQRGDTEKVDPAGEHAETQSERGGVIVHVDDGHASDDVEDNEEAESVEREVTPVDDTANEGDAQAEAEPSGVQHDGGDTDQHEEEDEEPDAQPPASTHQNDAPQATVPQPSSQFREHYVPLQTGDDDDALAPVHTYDDDDDSSDEDVVPTGVVEISSDDPKTAARAAAILKLHHSYIIDGVISKRARRPSPLTFNRRRSFAFGDGDTQDDAEHQDMIRRARRKSIANSGGVLQHRARQASHSPLARSVFVPPGSPAGSATSADDALREAETEIRAASVSPRAPRTPLRSRSFEHELPQYRPASPAASTTFEPASSTANRQEWAKSHWKRLDMCFTDERIAVAKAMGLEAEISEVDDVELDAVIDRFLADEAEEWDRDMLLRRATALSVRQRAGRGAPPSPRRFDNARSTTDPVVPVFTPLAVPRSFFPPSEISAPIKLPPSLLGPRYAHLHEEAAVSTVERPSTSLSSTREPDSETSKQGKAVAVSVQLPPAQPLTPQPARHSAQLPSDEDVPSAVPASATKRVLSYLGSFLGRGPPMKTAKPVLKSTFHALPLPPPEMRQTARGPVTTPAKKPIPKPQAPRELVHLAETQLPPRPSAPPRTKSAKEMVTLNHIDPPRSVQRPRTTSMPTVIPGRTRKDSGGSVKDLVRSFEEVQKRTEVEMARSAGSRGATMMRKVTSVGDLKGRAPWKP